MHHESYIGQKGYTISKAGMTKAEIDSLKHELFKVPAVSGKPDPDNGFPIYRENDKKIYLPRFFGTERYGMPERVDIQAGDPIAVAFNSQKPLFPHQEEAIRIYKAHVGKTPRSAGGILELACGMGKTVLALKLVSDLKRKTLILVHKEFLMEQWMKRIEEFLPTARVGKIQGPVRDIENKDIVLGMIQSIYNREFPAEMFHSFGFTIIDEVHRIGSCEFSNTLCKVVTPLILGISATVDRKDGLSDILYSFIGPKIHSAGRTQGETKVTVRSYFYKSPDPEFNEMQYDFRGQVKYSTMMSKLCNFAPRSDYMLQVIRETLKEQPGAQMIVLAHHRNLLVYFYNALTRPTVTGAAKPTVTGAAKPTVTGAAQPTVTSAAQPTVGYYVGGMKQKDLEQSETCQVVLATYAMAAEALDIKSLSILALCTPKTDVIQSVGRILRTKHSDPLILDFVDAHPVFRNQWTKRRQYYKKCNYDIVQSKPGSTQQKQQQQQEE